MPKQETVQGVDGAQVGRAKQDCRANLICACEIGNKVVAAKNIGHAILNVVSSDQPAHAVSDDVDLELGIAIILSNLIDQGVQLACRDDIVLTPIIGEDVV